MSASTMSEGRVSNIYVEPDAMTPPLKGIERPFAADRHRMKEVRERFDSDGYMEPISLKGDTLKPITDENPVDTGMTLSQLSDTY